MKQPIGAITYPQGFVAAGVRAGIKQKGEDIALVLSEQPAAAAGVFTKNVVQAASVIVSRSRVHRAGVRAIIVNSGNANSCTGEQGLRDAKEMTAQTARLLNVPEDDVLVASTGVIGHCLPMDKIRSGIEDAVRSLSREGGVEAARAIMTTDTRPKEATAEENGFGESTVRIGGMAKGAGMICPDMATMLAFITTDVAITPEVLQISLSRAVELSFNCLTIDGDNSTNDAVLLLANGMAGNKTIDSEGSDMDKFQAMLDKVCVRLAEQIAADGEGATKLVEIVVEGAESYEACRQIAKTVANSPLVKTALFGCDPNWGRILAAAGRSGVSFDPGSVSLHLGDTILLQRGEPVEFVQETACDYLSNAKVLIRLRVGEAPWSASVWTCDFSYDYVRINAEYHT